MSSTKDGTNYQKNTSIQCNNPYCTKYTTHTLQKYCSQFCRQQNQSIQRSRKKGQIYQPTGTIIHCTWCGKPTPSTTGKGKYTRICSTICKKDHDSNRQSIKNNGISTLDSISIYIKQKCQCKGCHNILPIHILTIDHIIPKTKKGTNTYNNAQLLCNNCNTKKYNLTMQEFITSERIWKIAPNTKYKTIQSLIEYSQNFLHYYITKLHIQKRINAIIKGTIQQTTTQELHSAIHIQQWIDQYENN